MKRPRLTSCAATAALLLATLVTTIWAPEAHAGGFFLPGKGVRPLGRGGVVVVSGAGDLNSIWYNPTNLATLTDTKLTVDMALIDLDFTFDRAPRQLDNGQTVTYDQVQNDAPPKADPEATKPITTPKPSPAEALLKEREAAAAAALPPPLLLAVLPPAWG